MGSLYLEKTLAVLRAPGGNNLKTGDRAVPSGIILRVLSGDTSSGAVRTTEDDWTWNVSTRHIICLSGRVDDLVDGLHCEVESHKLASTGIKMKPLMMSTCWRDVHRSETSQSGASRNACEAHLGDWCVDDTLFAELV